MSETRVSKNQPQGPAFAGSAADATPSAIEAPVQSASEAAKPKREAKVAKATGVPQMPARKVNGTAVRCIVKGESGKQCSNPARHEVARGKWTCSTHLRARQNGKRVSLNGRATLPVENLWSKRASATNASA